MFFVSRNGRLPNFPKARFWFFLQLLTATEVTGSYPGIDTKVFTVVPVVVFRPEVVYCASRGVFYACGPQGVDDDAAKPTHTEVIFVVQCPSEWCVLSIAQGSG